MSSLSNSLTAPYDVIIVGAGPVGVALSRLLGNAGVRVLILNREPDILRIPRAIALDDDGGRVLQALGDYSILRRQMPRIERMRMISPTVGDLASVNTNCWRNANPMVLTFRQPELEAALRAGLSHCPSVTFRGGVTLETFTEDATGVTAQVSSTAGSERLRGRYLVGCDGARSTVRQLLGTVMIGKKYENDWLVIDARCDPAPDREVHFLCDPKRPGVTMPAPNGGRRWEFMLGPADDRAQMTSPAVLRELLAPWGEQSRMQIERAAIYSFSARVVKNMQRGRVFLAGDAAHLTPPFAGQGLMAGLRDVFNLAWKLTAVLRGDAAPHLLTTYGGERLPNIHTMINLARFMGNVIMQRNPLLCFLRDRILRPMTRLPGLRRPLATLETKPRTRLSRGLLQRRLWPGRGLRPGDLVPQCTIRGTGTGDHAALLDEHLGYRWALIGHGVDPTQYLRRDQQEWWDRLGTAIAITADLRPAVSTSLATALTDLDGGLTGQLPAGYCLVERPDRHLYAICKASALEATLDKLARALGSGTAAGVTIAGEELQHAVPG